MAPRFILVEGPDGGGKTRLCLDAFPTFNYQHNGPPPFADPAGIFDWQLAELLPKNPLHDTIVDRSWPSDQIYHRFRAGGVNVFDRLSHRMFERWMFSVGGVIVMCLPPFDVAYRAWRARVVAGQELLTADSQFAEMYAFYVNWPATNLRVINFDYTEDRDYQDLQFELDDDHERYEFVANPAPGLLVGNPDARILVVSARNKARRFPFVGYDEESRWLTMQFERLELDEADLAWTNVRTPSGAVMPYDFLSKMPSIRTIIALGPEATGWANNVANIHTIIDAPDPAYARRQPDPDRVFVLGGGRVGLVPADATALGFPSGDDWIEVFNRKDLLL